MLIKAKRIDNLEKKVSEYKNRLVIEHLNEAGYKCDNTRISMIKVNNLLKSQRKRVIIEKQNEKISRLGSYYTWEAVMKIKIVDTITGKEE